MYLSASVVAVSTWGAITSARPFTFTFYLLQIPYFCPTRCHSFNTICHDTTMTVTITSYRIFQKACPNILHITSSNRPTDLFSFFHYRILQKIFKRSLNIPPQLKRVATLPCEMLMSENRPIYITSEIHQSLRIDARNCNLTNVFKHSKSMLLVSQLAYQSALRSQNIQHLPAQKL